MKSLRSFFSTATRRTAAVVAGTALAGSALITPTHAQQLPSVDELSSQVKLDNLSSDLNLGAIEDEIQGQLDNFYNQTRDQAWNTRVAINSLIAGTLNQAQVNQLMGVVDQAIEAVFPGLIAERTAPREEPVPAQPANNGQNQAPRNNPCPPEARACVDLEGRKTWLQHNGNITYGPVEQSPGYAHTPTPKGMHHVTRKVKDEISYEFNNAPMPYAVYFTNNGHAFHEGTTNVGSAGCVRLHHNDAVHYFNNLNVGDKVYIW